MGRYIGPWAALALVLAAAPAAGGLLPTNVEVTPDGDHYRYTYSIQLQSGAVLRPGDYFTIFDFAGLKDGSAAQPAGFTFSSAPTGPTPAGLHPGDDAGVDNLTWTYGGAEPLGSGDIGPFSAVSGFDQKTDDAFAGLSHRQVDGHLNGNLTDTQVPVPVAPGVPEPSSFLLLAAGVPLFLGWRQMRRPQLRRSVEAE
jgi:hypothetical protein